MSLKPDLKTQRQGGIDHKRMITILKTLGGKKKNSKGTSEQKQTDDKKKTVQGNYSIICVVSF